MTTRQLYPQWRDENRKLKYPFADTATLTNGDVVILNNVFLDGRLYPIGGGPRLFLSRISISGAEMTLGIRSVGAAELATAVLDTDDFPENGEVTFSDMYGRPAGVLLAEQNSLATLAALGQGSFEFEVDDTEFAASVVTPVPDIGLRGILTEDGELLTNDLWLVGEDGVVLRIDEGAIRIDIVGDPYAARKICSEETAEEGSTEDSSLLDEYCPLRTINEVAPNDRGNFHLLPGANQSLTNLLRIVPGPKGSLRILALGLRRFRDAQ